MFVRRDLCYEYHNRLNVFIKKILLNDSQEIVKDLKQIFALYDSIMWRVQPSYVSISFLRQLGL